MDKTVYQSAPDRDRAVGASRPPTVRRRPGAVRAARACLLALAIALPAFAAPGPVRATAEAAPARCPVLLDHRLPRLSDEKPEDLCRFTGQVLLVVNTASRCGFTDQYAGLDALHARYGARGFSVLGFPSADFAGQEFSKNADIARFCTDIYGVRFPMFARSSVRGANANPLYAQLARQGGGAPQWNFHKYLVDREGRVVAAFPSTTAPDDARIVRAIETLLDPRTTR